MMARKKQQSLWRRIERESACMHRVNWDFGKRFLRRGKWRWTGYALMDRVETWAKKHPKDVMICGVDDSHHMSSFLVLILHRIGRRLWGTSCVVIPQNGVDPIGKFLLYPGHAAELRAALDRLSQFEDWYRVPKRDVIVLTRESSREILKRLRSPRKPTAALRRLMKR